MKNYGKGVPNTIFDAVGNVFNRIDVDIPYCGEILAYEPQNDKIKYNYESLETIIFNDKCYQLVPKLGTKNLYYKCIGYKN